MSLDSFNAAALVAELQERVVDARLQKISQLSEEDFLLHLRSPGRTDKLLISLHRERSRFHLIFGPHPPAIVPSSFLMQCRKHVGGTRLLALVQPGLDRVLELSFQSEFSLVFDWTSAPPTLLLIKTQERTCVGRFPPGPRFVLRRPYSEPESSELPLAHRLESADALGALRQLPPATPLNQSLSQVSFGWSPRWSKRFCSELGSKTVGDIKEASFLELWSDYFAPLRGEAPSRPGLAEDGQLSYRVLPNQEQSESLQHAAVARWSESTKAPGIPDYRTEVLRSLRKGREKSHRKAEKRKKDRRGAESAPRDKLYGDLLLAYASQLKGRHKEFATTDWEGNPVTIALDPTMSPVDNAERYYTKAKKKKRALAVLGEQIQLAEEEVAFWDELLFAAERADNRTDLEEIRKSIPGPRQRKGRKTPEAPTSGPRRYEHGGFQLLVGRNPTQNEKLSLRQGAKDDHWFHIRQGAGSHVLLRTAGREPPSETILAAAWLAARFSRSSEGSRAEVVTTRIRFLKKPKGGPLGKVTYRQETEIVVDPSSPPPEGLEEQDKNGAPQ